MSGPRVGIVGPRRERQGLGPFVARDLVRAGAEIPCFLATSPATRDAAHAELRDSLGIEVRGHLDVEEMFAREDLDAVAILSPAETHARYLDAAVGAGLHILCEKPFVWGCADLAKRARRVTEACDEGGLCLWENCQWPDTLPFFEKLFPGARDAPPRAISMLLQPASTGQQALGDSMPHVISVAQALVPGTSPRAEDVTCERADADGKKQRVRFTYRTDRAAAEVEAELIQTDRHPRESALAVDGNRARRLVAGEDYRLLFAADGGSREVALDDPLTLLVGDFVAELRRGEKRSRSGEIAARMRILEQIVGAGPEDAAETG